MKRLPEFNLLEGVAHCFLNGYWPSSVVFHAIYRGQTSAISVLNCCDKSGFKDSKYLGSYSNIARTRALFLHLRKESYTEAAIYPSKWSSPEITRTKICSPETMLPRTTIVL